MKELWGADKLEAELAAAKEDLRGVEKNIRKILGRDAPDGENGVVQQINRPAPKRPLQEDRRRASAQDFQNNGFAAKRRYQPGSGNNNNNAEPKTVFSRLSARVPVADDSGDEDDSGFKPAVSSRVIATPREMPTRQDVLRRESTDERSKQRNRRMFGALLGTLQKFRQEETKLKAKEDKKAEIEARVEEAKRKEKEELKRERQQLFLNRKQQLAQVKALEAKVARSKQYQDWRAAQIPLLSFIKTKAEPHIYYLPKISTPETDTLLQESSKELKAEIDRREKELFDDLEIIQHHTDHSDKKSDKNMSMSDSQDQSMMEDEENRDVLPETNGDFDIMDVNETNDPNETNENNETHEANLSKESSEINETIETSETNEMDKTSEINEITKTNMEVTIDVNQDTEPEKNSEKNFNVNIKDNPDLENVINLKDKSSQISNDEEPKINNEHEILEMEAAERSAHTQEEDKENNVSTQEEENNE